MRMSDLKASYPLGAKVRIEEHLHAGQWAGGHVLSTDVLNVNHGTVEDHTTHPVPQIKVHLTSGHLFDERTYVHPHVWHVVNVDRDTVLEAINNDK